MNWKLILAESQTPSISWRQFLTDDGSGLQANKLASSMTNPDNISNYEDVGGMGSVGGVSGSTDIEAGDLKKILARKVSSNTGPSNTVNPSVLYPSAGVKLGILKA